MDSKQRTWNSVGQILEVMWGIMKRTVMHCTAAPGKEGQVND